MKRIINIMICLILLSLSGCILINPKTLDFGSYETTKTFTLTVIGNVEWSITPSESWITVDLDSGQGTTTVTVTVDRTGMEDGYYEGTLYVSTNPNVSCPDVIVKMTVGEVTTSTTTTSIAGVTTTTTSIGNGVPEPYFDRVVLVKYETDGNGVCIGGSVNAIWGNKGDA